MITEFLISAILSLSLSTNNSTPLHENDPVSQVPVNTYESKLFYSSGWETISTWSSTTNNGILNYTYSTEIKNNNDVVLVYVKGYDFEGFSKTSAKPLALPFYSMPASESSFNVFSWTSNTTSNKINISIKMADDLNAIFTAAKEKVQYRYFVISKDLLKSNKVTEKELRESSYSQIIDFLQVQE